SRDILENVKETHTGSLMFGLGVNYDAGVVGNVALHDRMQRIQFAPVFVSPAMQYAVPNNALTPPPLSIVPAGTPPSQLVTGLTSFKNGPLEDLQARLDPALMPRAPKPGSMPAPEPLSVFEVHGSPVLTGGAAGIAFRGEKRPARVGQIAITGMPVTEEEQRIWGALETSARLIHESAAPKPKKDPAPDGLDRLAARLFDNSGRTGSLLYQRPSFSGEERFFHDLIAYAPGLNTSAADVWAIVEAEARPSPFAGPGQVDASAQDLIA